MERLFFDRLYREISETQKRRSRLDTLKVTFITALLRFGAISIKDIVSFHPVLYLAPLAAVFLDFLAMGEHFSVCRLGAYLRTQSLSNREKKYETFVSKNRDKYFSVGSRGSTILSFIAAIGLILESKGELSIVEMGCIRSLFP